MQDAKMSLFCTEYLTSTPFQSSTQENQLLQDVTRGYYALQDYAILHMVDHMKSSENSNRELIYLPQGLTLSIETFRKEYRISDEREEEVSVKNHMNRQNWKHFEDRMFHIRDKIRSIYDKGSLDNANDDDTGTFIAIYGHPQFYCSRIGCNHFSAGFETKTSRDQHINRHNRPFLCLELGCPYHSMGFETEDQLKMHIMRTHADSSREVLKFSKPRKKTPDDLHKACARGDVAAVERFLDSGVILSSLSTTSPRSTPLVIAAQKSHLHICKLLAERGATINSVSSPSSRLRQTALHAAVSNNDIEMVQSFLSFPWKEPIELTLKDGRGRRPLDIAFEVKATAIADLLIAQMTQAEDVLGGFDFDSFLRETGDPGEMSFDASMAFADFEGVADSREV